MKILNRLTIAEKILFSGIILINGFEIFSIIVFIIGLIVAVQTAHQMLLPLLSSAIIIIPLNILSIFYIKKYISK